MSEAYSVVMTGKIIEGFDLDQVKANVSRLFKLNGEQLEKMFSGKPVTIRRGIDKEQAVRLRSALTKAGALAAVKTVRPAAEKVAPASRSNIAANAAPAAARQPASEKEPAPDTRQQDICCPRCGHQQPFATSCGLCKMDLTLHIQRLRRKEQARAARRQAAG